MSKYSVSCLAVFLVVACGSDEKPERSAGVDGEKPVANMTSDDLQKLCQLSERGYKALLTSEEAYCTRHAQGLPEQQCRTNVTECIGYDDFENEKVDDWECGTLDAEEELWDIDFDRCTAVLADVEACVNQLTDVTAAELDQASCENESEAGDDYPEACWELEDNCPGFPLSLFD